MEMGTCQGSLHGPQVLALVRLDDVHLVSPHCIKSIITVAEGPHRIPSGGITTFGPLIVESFGFDSLNTILLNVPFGAVQLVATMGGAWLATVWKMKGPVLALLCLPPIAGCVMLLRIPHDDAHKAPLLVGYYIVSTCMDRLVVDSDANDPPLSPRSLCTQASVCECPKFRLILANYSQRP